MNKNNLAALMLLLACFCGVVQSQSSKYAVVEDIVYLKDDSDTPLNILYKDHIAELHRLYDKSIFGSEKTQFPSDFRFCCPKIDFNQWAKMTKRQLAAKAKNFYETRLRTLITGKKTPIIELQNYLNMISPEFFSKNGQWIDPAAATVRIDSPQEFKETRGFFSIEEYRDLIRKMIEEHGPNLVEYSKKEYDQFMY